MPGNEQITEVRKRLEAFTSLLQVMADNEQDAAFADLTVQVRRLNRMTSELYKADPPGHYPELTESILNSLLQVYHETLMAASACIRENSTTLLDRSRTAVAGEIAEILRQDLAMLVSIDRSQMTTFPETVENARVLTLDLGTQELSSSSGEMSSRIPVEYTDAHGNKVSGFFTAESTFDPVRDFNDSLDKTLRDFPAYEGVISVLRMGEPSTDYYGGLIPRESAESMGGMDGLKPVYESAFLNMGLTEQQIRLLEAREDFEQFYYALSENSQAASRNLGCLGTDKNWLSLPVGSRIDNRNSAMSAVAELLGISDVIAHARPMEIIVNGEKKKGTFMVNAEGSELFHLRPDDPMRTYHADAYDSPDALRQMADLQVLDYICGNIDRHEGNFFFQFDTETDPAHPKLKKITGIDNDMAFGTNEYDTASSPGNRFVNKDSLVCLDKKTAYRIMSLDESMLRTVLQCYHFSEAEMNACWKRVSDLQEQIAADVTWFREHPGVKASPDHIRIMDEEDWKNASLKSLSEFETVTEEGSRRVDKAENNFSLFKGIDRVLEDNGISRELKPADTTAPAKRAPAQGVIVPKPYEGDEQTANRARGTLTALRHAYTASLLDEVRDATLLFRGSDEFKTMRELLTGINAITLRDEMTEEESRTLSEQYDRLALAASEYLEKKEREKDPDVPYGENTRSRIKAARKVLEAAASFDPAENHFVFDETSRQHRLKPGTAQWVENEMLSGIARVKRQYPGMGIKTSRFAEAFRGQFSRNMEMVKAYRAKEAEWTKCRNMAYLSGANNGIYDVLFAASENPRRLAQSFRQPGMKGHICRQEAAQAYLNKLLALEDYVFDGMETTEGCIGIMRSHGAALKGLLDVEGTLRMLGECDVKLNDQQKKLLQAQFGRYAKLAEAVNATVQSAEDPMSILFSPGLLSDRDRDRIIRDVRNGVEAVGSLGKTVENYCAAGNRIPDRKCHLRLSTTLERIGLTGVNSGHYLVQNCAGQVLEPREIAAVLESGQPVLVTEPGNPVGTILHDVGPDGVPSQQLNVKRLSCYQYATRDVADRIAQAGTNRHDPASLKTLRNHIVSMRNGFTPGLVDLMVNAAGQYLRDLGENHADARTHELWKNVNELKSLLDSPECRKAKEEYLDPALAQRDADNLSDEQEERKRKERRDEMKHDVDRRILEFKESVLSMKPCHLKTLGLAAAEAKTRLNEIDTSRGTDEEMRKTMKNCLSAVLAYEAGRIAHDKAPGVETFLQNDRLDPLIANMKTDDIRQMLYENNEASLLRLALPDVDSLVKQSDQPGITGP